MIKVTLNRIDASAAIAAFEGGASEAGAVASFIGKVRRSSGDKEITGLYLEHYPGMTEASIVKICEEASARWKVSDLLVIHRVGSIGAGEVIVLVCAASAHRREAFEAVDFMMDFLKTKALFWKKEISGVHEKWIEPRDADYQDAECWTEGR